MFVCLSGASVGDLVVSEMDSASTVVGAVAVAGRALGGVDYSDFKGQYSLFRFLADCLAPQHVCWDPRGAR